MANRKPNKDNLKSFNTLTEIHNDLNLNLNTDVKGANKYLLKKRN